MPVRAEFGETVWYNVSVIPPDQCNKKPKPVKRLGFNLLWPQRGFLVLEDRECSLTKTWVRMVVN